MAEKDIFAGMFFEIALTVALTCPKERLDEALAQLDTYLLECLKSGYTPDDIHAIEARVAQQCRPTAA